MNYKFTILFILLSGINFVVASSNISKHRSKYFSVYHTPNFPVIDAVSMSMNFPFVFRPVFVNYSNIKPDAGSAYNDEYTGLWVDGRIFNNLPIHAFNKLKTVQLEYQGRFSTHEVSVNEYDKDLRHNPSVFGLLIGDFRDEDELNDNLVPSNFFNSDNKNKFFGLSGLFTDILQSFLYNGSEGRLKGVSKENFVRLDVDVTKNEKFNIRTKELKNLIYDHNKTPYSNEDYELGLLDFSTPNVLNSRSVKTKSKKHKEFYLKEIHFKNTLIDKAHFTINEKIL